MIKRPCHGLPPGAPCPTYERGTWPRDCTCYQEAQPGGWADRIVRRWLIAALVLCLAFSFVMIKAFGADVDPSCLTHDEAARRYPNQWLYWHTARHCWDNHSSRTALRHPASPKTVRLPPPAPSIDMPEGPTVAYPSLMPGIGSSDNMLRPDPMTIWPPVFDFDAEPPLFIPWQQRVVSSLPVAGGGPE
jgi:hypothetical protein